MMLFEHDFWGVDISKTRSKFKWSPENQKSKNLIFDAKCSYWLEMTSETFLSDFNPSFGLKNDICWPSIFFHRGINEGFGKVSSEEWAVSFNLGKHVFG